MRKPKTKTPGETFSRDAKYEPFGLWIVGNTPLISHAWSEKARREMLAAEVCSGAAE